MRAPNTGVAGVETWGCADAGLASAPLPPTTRPPFPYLPNINQRFAIWQGDVTTLEVDAIANSTDETLMECDTISERVLQGAGPDLKEEILTRGLECQVGEAVVTPGFGLRCRHIVHTVCPKYVVKYHTAAETSLQSCYKNVLEAAGEVGARSLALPVLNTSRRNFPPDVAAHIALRTIRRHLEVAACPALVVVAVPSSGSRALYTALAPLYFPRAAPPAAAPPAALAAALRHADLPLHADRRIRIIHNPHSHNSDSGQ